MTNRIDREHPRPGATGSPRIRVPPAQLLEPVIVGSTPECCHCTACRTALREGQRIGVYAYRLGSANRWDLARIFCHTCTPDQLGEGTLGVTELLVTGTLGTLSNPSTQSHRFCVAEVLTETVSPATEGIQP